MNRIFQDKEISTLIEGPVGRLELKVHGLISESPLGVGVICHPHPLHGGNLDNKVIFTLARTLRELGFIAVRFNFRGVGASEGQYDDGRGELGDLVAVVDWAALQWPGLPITLAGFSFGGAIAAAYARDHHAIYIQTLILVSPALGHYGFDLKDRITVPTLVVQGEADEILPPELVYRWVQASSSDVVTLVRLADTGHFYHGKLTLLKSSLVAYLLA